MKIGPFEYVSAINQKTKIAHTRDYNPFLANLALSYSMDTIMITNEMNQYPSLPPECQFDFLYETVRKGKRFNKWYKEQETPYLEQVKILWLFKIKSPRNITGLDTRRTS